MSDPVISLKEYVDVRFSSVREAILKADTANEKRFDSVNEFRAQQADIVRNTMPRAEMEQRFASLEEKIAAKNLQIVSSFVFAIISTLVAVAVFARGFGA